ncbi:metal-dependent hydrolase [Halovivax cerinus]|uniref:Metal-dependent hydrolase n=1 Tax=Halovivax cerinus TaxID=1487865 RepID=A0ABD5NP92_9EURY|nr:metal-dependent hydrolase [Halovivax cerinus]
MYRDGHAGFNALLYAPAVPVVASRWSLWLALVGAVVAVGVSTLPDFDDPLPVVAHRGPTHTVWFALLVGLAAGVGTALAAPGEPIAFQFGVVVGTGGILAHLAGDVVTPMGISPFAPLWRVHVTLEWFASKNPRINRAFLIAGSASVFGSLALTMVAA